MTNYKEKGQPCANMTALLLKQSFDDKRQKHQSPNVTAIVSKIAGLRLFPFGQVGVLDTPGIDRNSLRPYAHKVAPAWSKHVWQGFRRAKAAVRRLLNLPTDRAFRNCPLSFPFGQCASVLDPLTHLLGKTKIAFKGIGSSIYGLDKGQAYAIRYVNASQVGIA